MAFATTVYKHRGSLWFCGVVLGTMIVGCVGNACAQAKAPNANSQPIIPPSKLFEQLSRPDAPQFTQEKTSALKSLGIDATDVEDFRLTYEDLDGDGETEALFTIEVDGANVMLVVLKRKGDQWYRLASPPDFSCWCRYEYEPLDTFAEIRSWSYGDQKREPVKLIFLRESGGGTGLYDRGLRVYALRGFELKEVFHITEERRECEWPDPKCDLYHNKVTLAHETEEPGALVVSGFEKHLRGGDFYRDTWWIGMPIQHCNSYTWNAQRWEFTVSPRAALAYCSHLGKKSPEGVNR